MLTGTGDLGRRLAGQRERCGLNRAETADRDGVAVSYLEYLGPAPRPTLGRIF